MIKVKKLLCSELGHEKPYAGKEKDFQKATCNFLAYYEMFDKSAYHIPNERKESATRIDLSLQGVKPGVSDWCISIPFERGGVQYHGMYLELKAKGGRISNDQIDFLNIQHKLGFYCAVIWNFESFEKVINWAYLNKI